MKLVKCPKCGAPQLIDWTLDQYTMSDRVHCHACGYSDFVYVFLERGNANTGAAARLGDNFAADVRDIVSGLRADTAINMLLSSLSRRYRLSTFALVDIINSLLGSKTVESAPYNPLDYVTLDESQVDAATLLRQLDDAVAEARAAMPLAMPVSAAGCDDDRWRMQYEECLVRLDRLNDKYEHLRSAFETLKAENRRLREYLGE